LLSHRDQRTFDHFVHLLVKRLLNRTQSECEVNVK
jgi:hypothetical protein